MIVPTFIVVDGVNADDACRTAKENIPQSEQVGNPGWG